MTWAGWRDPVRRSDDLDRIVGLPRRPPLDLDSVRAEALVELAQEQYGRDDPASRAPACGCQRATGRLCLDRLLPSQAWALREAPLSGGLVGLLGVGSGKTVLNLLAALAFPDCRVAVILVPPGLVGQLEAEYLRLRRHFRVPSLILAGGARGWVVEGAPVAHVVPYSLFSSARGTDVLERLAPDLVVADEAHSLRNRTSYRTGRFLRYLAGRPEVRLCAWSGTMVARSVCDATHLAAFALREGSPLPLDADVADEWAGALDPSDWPAPSGALRRLGEPAREAVSRRVLETRGVVSTRATDGVGASLSIEERSPPKTPAAVSGALKELRASWARPDGEEFVDALRVAACARQLACGFYYRWRFPRGEPRDLVDEWLAARGAWRREAREWLRDPRPHLDSLHLLAVAAERHERGERGAAEAPAVRLESWPRWAAVRGRVRPETESVWLDDWLARDAAAWVSEARGVAWYESGAFGRRVASVAGLPVHGGGLGAEAAILAERGDRGVVASLRAHGQGRDGLQLLFSEQLVCQPPADGAAWEQVLGRLHRVGQRADEVRTYVYRHEVELADAVDSALRRAHFIRDLSGAPQKLLALAGVGWRARAK